MKFEVQMIVDVMDRGIFLILFHMFKAIVDNNLTGSNSRTINVADYNPMTTGRMLKYLYNDTTSDSASYLCHRNVKTWLQSFISIHFALFIYSWRFDLLCSHMYRFSSIFLITIYSIYCILVYLFMTWSVAYDSSLFCMTVIYLLSLSIIHPFEISLAHLYFSTIYHLSIHFRFTSVYS